MGKLKNVSADEMKQALDHAFDVSQELNGLLRRAEQGYIDAEVFEKPAEAASSLLSLSRHTADFAAFFLMKAGLNELRQNTVEDLSK